MQLSQVFATHDVADVLVGNGCTDKLATWYTACLPQPMPKTRSETLKNRGTVGRN